MKILIIPFMLFLASCCNEDEKLSIHSDCIQMEQNSDFVTEELNQDYTIQFPKDFTGTGLDSTSFISFRKEKSDKITFSYTFNSDIGPSFYYGHKLPDPFPLELDIPTQSFSKNLNIKKDLCIDDKIVGILYYNQNGENEASNGKLFLEYKTWYYEALQITFSENIIIEEIFEILKTIKKK